MCQIRSQPKRLYWSAKLLKSVAILATLFFVPAHSAYSEELNFLTWADYMDPGIVEEFEQETGISINFTYFASDDARDEMINNQNGQGYDLVIINGLMLKSYSSRNWLAPTNKEEIPNLAHIEPRWIDIFPASGSYAVPYFWGTFGIAYRKDLVPEGFSTWKDFFEPSEELRDKIVMLQSSRGILGMALKSLGHSANTNDRKAIKEAGQLLRAQRPFVHSYEYFSLNEQSALVSGEAWAALAYSGDALTVQQQHEQITYVIPEEGGNLWVDYLAVFKNATRQDLANKFIDFLNRPEIAARNAEYLFYASPNQAALEHVSDEYKENRTIYPDSESIEKSEIFRELAPRSQKLVNSIFVELVN